MTAPITNDSVLLQRLHASKNLRPNTKDGYQVINLFRNKIKEGKLSGKTKVIL